MGLEIFNIRANVQAIFIMMCMKLRHIYFISEQFIQFVCVNKPLFVFSDLQVLLAQDKNR